MHRILYLCRIVNVVDGNWSARIFADFENGVLNVPNHRRENGAERLLQLHRIDGAVRRTGCAERAEQVVVADVNRHVVCFLQRSDVSRVRLQGGQQLPGSQLRNAIVRYFQISRRAEQVGESEDGRMVVVRA
ncbi:hypothetical protein D3C84_896690 [compost metagenome]